MEGEEAVNPMNILIIGPKGAGKSTFIKAFVNYLNYDSLEDAMQNETINLNPSAVLNVNIGNSSSYCLLETYTKKITNSLIHFIDSTNIWETGKKLHFKEIVRNCIKNYDGGLNGILIIMKPTDEVFKDFLDTVIKGIVASMTKESLMNISFVFTNARTYDYHCEQMFPDAKKVIHANGLNDHFSVKNRNVYYVDNDSLDFLKTLHSNSKFSRLDFTKYSMSWGKYSAECKQLMSHLFSLKPLSIENVLSVNDDFHASSESLIDVANSNPVQNNENDKGVAGNFKDINNISINIVPTINTNILPTNGQNEYIENESINEGELLNDDKNGKECLHDSGNDHMEKSLNLNIVPEGDQFENATMEHFNDKLNVQKEINILLIGEPGVGKSTWINGLHSYLNFSNFDEALNKKQKWLVPIAFSLFDSNLIEENIVTEAGDMVASFNDNLLDSQMPRSYSFFICGYNVNLIDTPGIEKFSSIEQGEESLKIILEYVACFEEIHAICILVKPNNARLTNSFEYCLEQVIKNLETPALKNIAFVLTSGRMTNYQYGDTVITIKSFLKDKALDEDILLNMENVFCIDNEAVRILAASEAHLSFDMELKSSYVASWEKSLAETIRLVDYASKLKSCKLKYNYLSTPLCFPSSMQNIISCTPGSQPTIPADVVPANGLKEISGNTMVLVENQSICNNLKAVEDRDQPQKGIDPQESLTEERLTEESCLPTPKAFQQMNILVLGETGVGKSTWINGLANYLSYETLQAAIEKKPIYLIPSSYTIVDKESYEEILIPMGDCNTVENSELGQSETQIPKTYSFESGKVRVSFIDTPGIGDTRGLEQDKKNFEYIMCHLSHLDKLHGICILLKPGQARLTASFEFCFKELLKHLHKNACKNVVFVFTNSRGTNFKPGDTLPIINEILSKNNLKDVLTINSNRIYYVDNEGIRFLAANEVGISYSSDDLEMHAQSWKKSFEESQRLMFYISNLRPHAARMTVSLNNVRRTIFALAQPLAQVSENIQANVSRLESKRKEIRKLKESGESLRDKLTIPKVILHTKSIEHPRLVCTSRKCTENVIVDGELLENYSQCCHAKCYLKGMSFLNSIHAMVKLCKVFKDDICTVCGCSWRNHRRITYEHLKTVEQIVHREIEEQLKQNDDDGMAANACMQSIQRRIDELQNEQYKIIHASVQCEIFIEQNSTLIQEDIMADSMQQIIDCQKGLFIDGNTDRLQALEDLMKCYCEEKEKFKHLSVQLTPCKIQTLLLELYEMPLNGHSVQECLKSAQNASSQIARSDEVIYRIKQSFISAIGTTFKFARKLLHPFS